MNKQVLILSLALLHVTVISFSKHIMRLCYFPAKRLLILRMELNTYSNVLCGGSGDFPAPCLLSVFKDLSFKRRGRAARRDERGAGQGPATHPWHLT